MLVSTFVLTCLAWIVFRASTMGDAVYVVTHLARGWDFQHIKTTQFMLRQLPIAVLAIIGLELGQLLSRTDVSVPSVVGRLPLAARWATYAAFVLLVLLFGVYQKTQFIYFQF
jgi:hypothetical protein